MVVIAGVWFELSPWGERVTGTVLELQAAALNRWGPHPVSGDDASTGTGAVPAPEAPAARPLSRTVTVSLVIIGALVWWESRLLGWAIASSLAALAALLAVSTMMLPHGVLVPTAGPGLAIVAGMLGRRVLEAVIAFRDRGQHPGDPPPRDVRPGE